MKNFIISVILFSSFAAEAARVECRSGEHTFIIQMTDSLKVTFLGETVPADGILSAEEVDLVARFKSIGEMTLFAKIGKESPDSYAFVQGKRISVLCR